MKDLEATNLFHGKEHLNCAQSVFKAFQQENGLPDRSIDEAKAFGGGRAPGGLCGAVYAAGQIISGASWHRLESDFAAIAGSTKCNRIREMKQLSCSGCVALAARLVESFAHQIRQDDAPENTISVKNQCALLNL